MTRVETAVILAIDVVGRPEADAEQARREDESVVGDDIEDAGGRVFKNTDDGLLAACPSVTAALGAAVAIQQHCRRRRRGARVGISIGDATAEDGDYFGVPPIEATRLCAAARVGEILIVDRALAMLGDDAGHRFESAGALDLKVRPQPVPASRVGWDPLPPAPLPARLRRGSPAAYVGRAAEQRALGALWDRAVDGMRQVVLISGEPGIGKTALVSEAARAALAADAVVLYGHCDEDHGVPYLPWLGILRDYVDVGP